MNLIGAMGTGNVIKTPRARDIFPTTTEKIPGQ